MVGLYLGSESFGKEVDSFIVRWISFVWTQCKKGLLRELNPGPLAPEVRIIPLDQAANERKASFKR